MFDVAVNSTDPDVTPTLTLTVSHSREESQNINVG